jgi:hypothetical protein
MAFSTNVVGLICLAALAVASEAAQPEEKRHAFNIIPPEAFLQLTNDNQVAYVSGLLEGMLFAASAYGAPNLDRWAACVASKTVGDTTNEVITFLKDNPGFAEDMPSALARTIGRRCRQ